MLSKYASNAAEAFVGAVAFRWLHKEAPRLDTLRETVILLLCAGFLAPLVSSFLDATFVALNGWEQAGYWTNWRARFLSSVLSAITIVPLIVTTTGSLSLVRQVPRRTWIEAVVIFSLLLAASWFVFVRARVAPDAFPALVYAPFPLLAASALRLGPWGASTSFLAYALVAIWGAVQGHGPFVAGAPADNALALQLFLIIASVPVMSLASLTEDRARAESKARQSEEQLDVVLDAAQLGRWEWDIAQQRLDWSDITRRMYLRAARCAGRPRDLCGTRPSRRSSPARGGNTGRPSQTPHRGRVPHSPAGRHGAIDHVERQDALRRRRSPHPDGRDQGGHHGAQAGGTAVERAGTRARPHRPVVDGGRAVGGDRARAEPAVGGDPDQRRRGQAVPLRTTRPTSSRLREIVDAIAQDNRRAAAVIHKVGALLRRDDLPRAPLQLNDVVEDVIDIARGDTVVGRACRSASAASGAGADCRRSRAAAAGPVEPRVERVRCDGVSAKTARRLTVVTARSGPPGAGDGVRYRARRRRASTGRRLRAVRDLQATRTWPRPRRLSVDRQRPRRHAVGREQPGRRRVLLLRAAVPDPGIPGGCRPSSMTRSFGKSVV